MAVSRAHVEATKAFIRARVGNPYVYGGALSTNVRQGTDCSEVWQTVLEMVHGRWVPGRQAEGATTESYRYIPVGGRGPFGTIRVARWQDIPADAAAKIAFHHGPGGGANSHMWGELDGMRIESRGGAGLVTGGAARAINDGYAHAWAYLPGPIVGEAGDVPPTPDVVYLGRDCSRYECRGERVRALQQKLNDDYPLYSALDVDGEFGPATEGAVKEFQRRSYLTVDGIAGPATLAAIGLTFQSAPSSPVDADALQVLAKAMRNRVSMDRYRQLLPAVQQCLRDCDCTTIPRIAMWFAQVGHESGGLKHMEEIASGADYEGRADLGNVYPGDGVRFKGRGPIQVTGRHNYTQLSKWAHSKGLIPSPTFFVDNPAQLSSDKYGFVGVTWYWTTQRPMNAASDARDLERATRYVNGGLKGLSDRRDFYNIALGLGDDLLSLIQSSGGISMADAKTILDELWDDKDKIKVYDGAGKDDGFSWAQLPDAGWWAWDLRGWVKQLVWDLLRFQRPADFKTGDLRKKWGMRDSITRQHFLAEQNNELLRRLAQHSGVDITDLP